MNVNDLSRFDEQISSNKGSEVSGGWSVAVISDETLTVAGVAAALEVLPDVAVRRYGSIGDAEVRAADLVVYDLALTLQRGEAELRNLTAGGRPVLGLGRAFLPQLGRTAGECGVTSSFSTACEPDEVADVVEGCLGLVRRTRRPGPLGERGADRLPPAPHLSEREADVLRLIAAGHSNQEIAEQLYLSINTIKTHIRTAYRRIGVRSRFEAIRWLLGHDIRPRLEAVERPVAPVVPLTSGRRSR